MLRSRLFHYSLGSIVPILIFIFSLPGAVEVAAADGTFAWEAHLRDSLFSLAAEAMYPVEPSVQEILDNLGYDIDAENDALELDEICVFPQSVWRLVAEYTGAAETHEAGWYTALNPADTHAVITGSMIPGESTVLNGVADIRQGLFLRRDAGTTWYIETALNYDSRGHHKVYELPNADGYIVFWEDLGWMTDGDFNDMVFEVYPENLPPTISVDYHKLCSNCPPYLICEGDSVCIEIHVQDPGCFGNTVTVEMVSGEGEFVPITGVSDFYAVHCWLPIWEGVRYFVFRATDNLGLSVEKEFWSNVKFDHDPPILPEPVSLEIGACLPEQICVDFPITDTSYTWIWIEPDGLYDEERQVVCFDADTAGIYELSVIAADTCGNADTTLVTVTVAGGSPPQVTANPDNQFEICEPERLCVVFSVYDPDNDVVSIWTDAPGIINLTDSTLCYLATGSESIQLPIYVMDACGDADTALVNFEITGGSDVALQCPEPIDTLLCEDGIFCFPISYTGGTGEVVISVLPDGFYSLDRNEACFPTQGSGHYDIMVIAQDDCGADTCTVPVDVTINRPPVAGLPDDFATFVCDDQNLICVEFGCSDPDDNLQSCDVIEAPAGYQISGIDNDEICFNAPTEGVYRIIVAATDECGEISRDTVNVDVAFNSAPVVDAPAESAVGLCAADSVCVEIGVFDSDDNLATVTVSENAAYNETDGLVCFYASDDGVYSVRIIAVDECAAADTAEIAITVNVSDPVTIQCPDPVDTMLCGPAAVCLPMPLPTYNGGLNVVVEPTGYYDQITEELCFNADTAGYYELTVMASDTCGGADTCTAVIDVSFNQLPDIGGEEGLTFELCEPQEVCIPASCSDPDDNLVSCELVSGPGTFNGSEICFVPSESGRVYFIIEAEDACGESRQLQLYADVVLNEEPVITVQATVSELLCEPAEVCVEFTAVDPEGGPVTVTSSAGSVDPGAGTLCVFFDDDASLCVELYARDTCDRVDTAQVCFDIDVNQKPSIDVADQFSYELCNPGQVCFPIEVIEPEGVKATSVKPAGAFNDDFTEVCFDVDTSGVYEITLIVMDTCLVSDTATTQVTIALNNPPVVVVPVDAEAFLCATDQQVCVTGISALDSDDNLAIVALTAGIGQFNQQLGELCFIPDTVGLYCFEITATDECQATDAQTFCVAVLLNGPPVITLEPNIDVTITEPGPVCFPVRSDDPDVDQWFNLAMVSGAGSFLPVEGRNTISADHCFDADTSGCYPFTFESIDSCGLSDVKSTLVCVNITPPDTSYKICVDTLEALNGHNVDVDVIVYEAMEMGGFDLLICYDRTVLSFMGGARGAALEEWEYFTYRAVSPDGCAAPCDASAIRLLGIADMNNGFEHPSPEAYTPVGTLAILTFYVSEDRSLIGQCARFTFCSYDCGDNTISSRSGDTLFVSYEEIDPECLEGLKYDPIPAIDFCEGRICIVPPLDDRGDINLNGLANEVADAVLFTNYFIYGNSVWDPVYYENQWLASDINDDGITRSVADLVYLIRIITGDAEPFPNSGEGKPAAPTFGAGVAIDLDLVYRNGEWALYSESTVEIGGLFVRLEGDLEAVDPPEFGDLTTSSEPKFNKMSSEVRLLFAGMAAGAVIPAGPVELARFAGDQAAQLEIAEAQASTYDGNPLNVEFRATAAGVPQRFELAQNYPNPFNAGTIIRLALPTASTYKLSIYDISGRRVREFDGYGEAGEIQVYWDGTDEVGDGVASGIYFYRASAGKLSATRKMILIK